MEEAAEADRVAVFRAGRVAITQYADEILITGGRNLQLNLICGVVLLGHGASCEGRARSCAGARGGYGRRDCAGICRPGGEDTAGRPSASDSRVLDNVSSATDGTAVSEPVIEISHLSHSYSLSARERRRWRKRSVTAGKSNKQALWGKRPQQPVGAARCIADGASRRVPGLGRSYRFG